MHLLFHFAYLDPGTGSLIIQSLIGAVAGVAVFGRKILAAIKLKFTKGSSPAPSDKTVKTTNSAQDTKQAKTPTPDNPKKK